MHYVKPKKHLGQHFLRDLNVARSTAELIQAPDHTALLEIGPGTGVLTQFLLDQGRPLHLAEVDVESIAYLKQHFPAGSFVLHEGDFLRMDWKKILGPGPWSWVGNFPYNISSQILFKALEYREELDELAGMFQKEVAVRVASGPGNRDYGILSVLLQTYYTISYAFDVPPEVFNPPPKVWSGVIHLKRKPEAPQVDEAKLKMVVKLAFNQRRKTLRNALKSLNLEGLLAELGLDHKRAEQLHWTEFVELVNRIPAP